MNIASAASFRHLLMHDHLRLDALLGSILELVHVNEHPNLDALWTSYEEALLAHLDAEEMFLLPGLTRHDSACARRIQDEHVKIRAMLAELGVALDLHILREERVLELSKFLCEHAEMEENPLYTWANLSMPESYFGALARRLRVTWQRLSPGSQPPSGSAPPPAHSTPTNSGRADVHARGDIGQLQSK